MEAIAEDAWYREFFRHDYRAFWHPEAEDDPARDAREADGVELLLGLRQGSRILDVCCGQGRHSVELARRGYRVTGLDLSETMLAEARERAAAAGATVDFLRADMREIPFACVFDAAINMFTAFGYLESDEQDARCLRAVARALRPGGAFLLDLPNQDSPSRRHSGLRTWREVDEGRFLLTDHWFELHPRAWRMRTIVLDGGERREYKMKIRAYTADELERMFLAAGFRAFQVFGDWGGEELVADSPRLLSVGRV